MKVVAIIAQKDFRDEELFDTKMVLEANGIEVRIAALSDSIAIGKLGAKVSPGLTVADIQVDSFVGCIVIGGPGAYSLIEDPTVRRVVQTFAHAGKLVAAICVASAVLAEAGLLADRRATIHFSAVEYLTKAGAIYNENDIEVDGNIITGSGPAIAARFGQEIVDYLKNTIK